MPNYVDPFCGSLAVPLLRPHAPKVETVNDADGLLVNFWRAVSANPEAVAKVADWPVSEADLHPRHAYLVAQREELAERLLGDPDFYDAKLAAWWVWGQCAWIGTGWCSGRGPWITEGARLVRRNPGRGINRQLPHLGDPGRGINRQLPHLGDPGRGDLFPQGQAVLEWFRVLQARTRRMRIACGDWRRVLTGSVLRGMTTGSPASWRSPTGILLDPPYDDGLVDYGSGSERAAQEVAKRAGELGENGGYRVAVFGLCGDYNLPGWEQVAWTRQREGGYGNAATAHRQETIWFSPGCLSGAQGSLPFDAAAEVR